MSSGLPSLVRGIDRGWRHLIYFRRMEGTVIARLLRALTLFACIAVLGAGWAQNSFDRDMDFLLRHAPPQDLPFPDGYAEKNCRLAAEARASAPEAYPDDIYLDYVLPHTVIREGVDDWRASFRERFSPIVAGMTNAYDAAVALDRTIWDMIGVHYSTLRDQARQTPSHSIRTGKASCTGISIILIDACRALGIPARLVGCNWTTIPGNHSWVEVYSGGRWRTLASGEKEREDAIWFLDYADRADSSRPETRIYASRYSPSPEGILFWRTWEHPSQISDVPADDVTRRYSRYAVAVSQRAAADDEWMAVARALAAKHADAPIVKMGKDFKETLAAIAPRHVAFVFKPQEAGRDEVARLHRIMRSLDEDPFDDAVWGIVTAPTPRDALAMVNFRQKAPLCGALATTGVDFGAVTGECLVISDACKGLVRRRDKEGRVSEEKVKGCTTGLFVDFWDRADPQLLFTSGHATERNLEMSYSTGNIVSKGGVFVRGEEPYAPLAAPKREKVWLAAGNCLIAHDNASDSMIMTALGFGKVRQFVGYVDVTWFGAVGWGTAENFFSRRMSLSESWHFARQANRWRMLSPAPDERTRRGREWDDTKTAFYGDPAEKVVCRGEAAMSLSAEGDGSLRLTIRRDIPASGADTMPYGVLLPARRKALGEVLVDGFRFFVGDDFIMLVEWPNLAPGEKTIQFQER